MADLTLTRGDTGKFDFTVTDDGAAVNLTGKTLWFTAKSSYGDGDAAAVIALDTTGGGVTLTDAAAGQCRVTVPAASTSGLAAATVTLVWDLQLKDGASIYTVASGKLTISPDVTQSTS